MDALALDLARLQVAERVAQANAFRRGRELRGVRRAAARSGRGTASPRTSHRPTF
ncbi:MAG TPA: hypothetical protein VFQ19_16795 [Nocardioidaceae bacterium]|nr:hypothetical protein [Nocardioidaceae bacterium]